MKKFEITEEQIKELTDTLHKERVNYLLKEWFPEAFKPELQIGRWYKSKDGATFFVTEIDKEKCEDGDVKGYGINYAGDWVDGWDWAYVNNEHGFNVEATDEEVKEALINETERRGFYYGNKFKEVKDRRNSGFMEKSGKVGSEFDFSDNKLYTVGFGRWCVFKDGIWAEVFKEPVTLNYQQIADKFGIDVEQLRISKI